MGFLMAREFHHAFAPRRVLWYVATVAAVVAQLFWGCASRIHIERRMASAPLDWPTYGGSSGRANESTSALKPPLKLVWEYNAMSGISGTPLVRDSVVLVGTLQGELHAFRLSDGESLGYSGLESAVVGTPVWDGAFAYVATGLGNQTLICLSLRDGQRRWSARLGAIESSPLMIGAFLYVTTLDGSLVALTKEDGKEVWRFDYAPKEFRKTVRSSPASDGEVIIFGSDDGGVYAVERLSGQLRWKAQLGSSIFAAPVIANGMCFAGTLDGILTALDTRSGSVRWTYESGSRIYAPPAVSTDRVFLGSADGSVVALSIVSGERAWTFSARSSVSSAPLISGDLVYVGSLDRTLYALRAASGEKVWAYEVEGRIRVSPVIWGDVLLLTYEDKYVAALRPDLP
jgi:outer membrane protein assembly factor BamB